MQEISFSDLKDKVAVITGGAGVLGSSIALGLASVGVKTVISGRTAETVNRTAEMIKEKTGIDSIGVCLDVLDRSSIEKGKAEVNEKLGKVDFLINCAGGNSPKATASKECMTPDDITNLDGTFFSLDVDAFSDVFDLNFKGTLLPTMIFGKDMIEKGNGAVLNISSMSAYHPLTKIGAYSASKAAINNFTEWLAVHLAKVNIRVNAVAPGFFLTKQNKFLLTDEETGDLTPRGKKIIESTPMEKFGEPEDLQGTVLYLLSDLSKFVTGIVVPVDGGFNAYSGV